ncbi:MAG: hypothetical protein KGP14_11065 [Betaproteobacteria bacterium]|nr:hypothetical protein [Betaproteobacteria bacterium]
MLSYDEIPAAIRVAVNALPQSLLNRSGSIFYSGKEAFAKPSALYILGLNPGGLPSLMPTATIGAYLERFRNLDRPWSEYQDESWEDAEPGCWGLQPRILHMLGRLGLDPQQVPSSNVVFVKTRGERELESEKAALLEACWPVHQAIIESLNVRVVLCFGGTAGAWTRSQLGADELIDSFSERNNRGWTSRVHRSASGIEVVTATHPSRADWRNQLADPTPLVETALARSLQASTQSVD